MIAYFLNLKNSGMARLDTVLTTSQLRSQQNCVLHAVSSEQESASRIPQIVDRIHFYGNVELSPQFQFGYQQKDP